MKKELTKALEELEVNELDELLDEVKCVDPERGSAERVWKNACMRAGLGEEKRAERRVRLSRRAVVALAACVAVMASLGIGAFAYAEEAREYGEAVAFCEQNDIDVTGMTRGEIKEVYRSFKNGTLVYDTEQPGEPEYTESTQQIGGTVIPAETFAPEEPVEYRPDDRKVGMCCWEEKGNGSGTVSYYFDHELVWSCEIEGMDYSWPEWVDDGMVLTGWERGTLTPMAIKLDDNGEFLWSRTLGEGEITAVTGENDGSVTIFAYCEDYASGTNDRVIVSRIDPEGGLVWQTETVTPDPIRIGDEVEHYGEGYLAIGYIDDFDGIWNAQRIVRFDGEGNLMGEFSYSADGVDYHLYDIELYGEKLYISAYVRDDSVFGSLCGDETWANAAVSDEEFTDMVKRAFKAVLLVCDPETCEISSFCEAEGSYCRDLKEDGEGFLCWDVNSVYSASYVPGLNSEAVKGKVGTYTCRFDLDGRLVDRTDHGEVMDF